MGECLPVIPDDKGGPPGQGYGAALLVNLHPEDGVLRGPQHAAVHVDSRAPRGGDVWRHVADGRRSLRLHQAHHDRDH